MTRINPERGKVAYAPYQRSTDVLSTNVQHLAQINRVPAHHIERSRIATPGRGSMQGSTDHQAQAPKLSSLGGKIAIDQLQNELKAFGELLAACGARDDQAVQARAHGLPIGPFMPYELGAQPAPQFDLFCGGPIAPRLPIALIQDPIEYRPGQPAPHLSKIPLPKQRINPQRPIRSSYTQPNSLNFSRITRHAQTAAQFIKDDFTSLSLVKMFLPHKQEISQIDFETAVRQTSRFLQSNGRRGNAINSRLLDISQHMCNNPVLIRQLGSLQPHIVALTLNEGNVRRHSLQLEDTLLSMSSRLDKRETGLSHTLFRSDNNTWFESLKSYDLGTIHDWDAMNQIHKDVLLPQGKAKQKFEDEFTAILGRGTFGKVVPARNIRTGEIMAGKKVLAVDQAEKEYQAGQKLKTMVRQESKDAFILVSEGARVFGAPSHRTGTRVEKAILFSPLAKKSDEFTVMGHNLSLKRAGKIVQFEQKNFEQVQLFCLLVQHLEANEIVHPDLKPENIFGGRLGDVGDVITRGQAYRVHTAEYTLPNTQRRPLNETEFRTFNRFSIGAMMFQSIIGHLPTSPTLPASLRLPSMGRYCAEGFSAAKLSEPVPSRIDGIKMTAYDKKVLQFSKRLMASDRESVRPSKFNLNQYLNILELAKTLPPPSKGN